MKNIEDCANAIEQVLLDRKLISVPIPWRQWAGPDFFGCDAYGFEIDMSRFKVKRIEALHSQATLRAISTRLGGVKVSFANTQGFIYLVKNEPVSELLSFPNRVELPEPPGKNYLIPFGVDRENRAAWRSLFRTHNVVVGGQTQYGKTTGFFAWYSALTAQHSPAELQFGLIDGKNFEFVALTNSPWLISGAPATEGVSTAAILIEQVWDIVKERKDLFKRFRVGTLTAYQRQSGVRLPVVVLMIDEIKELVDVGLDTKTLNRILQQGVGVGVFCIIGTQKPDTKTINKTNFNTFVAYRLSNAIEAQILFGIHEPYHLLKNSNPGELVVLGPDLNYAHLKSFYIEKHFTPALSSADRILVVIAVKKFDGFCPIDRMVTIIETDLPFRYKKLFTKHYLQKKFLDWESAGWLEPARRQDDGSWLARRVSPRLRKMAGV
jgi:hypothetical protein